MEPLRVGILGAARITELALIKPAKITGTRLVAVAARDTTRATAFAELHGIDRVHASYLDVINDPEVEAIYNPLANSLHAPWNKAALAAGKHVFTEKPSASNATEAQEVAAQVGATDRQFFEGFHYLWHPLITRLHAILASGELGELRRVETVMDMPAPDAADPRWSAELAGGALMDLGCYSLHSMRILPPSSAVNPP
jgi:predicted dehydrogenase